MQNPYINFSFRNKVARAVWGAVWLFLYLPSPRPLHAWRAFLLRLFGAKIGKPVYIYPTSKVWAPWNLMLGDHSTLADHVDCYSVDKVVIGANTTVSQYCYLCPAGHDYLSPEILTNPQMPLLTAPITIGDRVWLTSHVFVGPGVCISNGAVVLSRSSVFKDIPSWSVYAGNPAIFIKQRILRNLD